MNVSVGIYLFAGFLAVYLFNRFLNASVCRSCCSDDYTQSLIPMLGVGLYSFLGRVAYSVTFSVSIITGVLVSFLLRAKIDRPAPGAIRVFYAGNAGFCGVYHRSPAVERIN